MSTKKQLLMLAGIAACALILCSFFLITFFNSPKKPVDPGLILSAVQRFCAEQKSFPKNVHFSELIARGYLPANTLEKFGASEVTVYLGTNDASPQTFFMDAQLPDGTHQILLSDGSVEQLTESRRRELLEKAQQ